MNSHDDLHFAAEGGLPPPRRGVPWKILIADDDDEVHRVTRLALDGLYFDDRGLEFLDVYSGRDAVQSLADHPDIAIALLDVVMESESAGLDAVAAIRGELNNRLVRLVLRTGQPGQAPAREVVARYDINDYKEKTELTATRLFTLIYTGLSQYRDLCALESGRAGLERVIAASAGVFEQRTPQDLAEVVLNELALLTGLELSAGGAAGGFAVLGAADSQGRILSGVGCYAGSAGRLPQEVADEAALQRLRSVPAARHWQADAQHFHARLQTRRHTLWTFYLGGELRVPQHQLLDLFCANVAIAVENAELNQEVARTQSELIFMLGEAIEKRSEETGNHVRRVAEYSFLLARLSGLDEDECEVLRLASPLHDAGKIAIPDAILNKPGRHTAEEAVIMKAHATHGHDLFRAQTLPVLKAAAIVAAQHHERWDGLGYPQRLRGEEIHLYGRITALADVFDALGSRRCYKEAWPPQEVLDLIHSERGRHFDPQLVDLFFQSIDDFMAIRERLADPP